MADEFCVAQPRAARCRIRRVNAARACSSRRIDRASRRRAGPAAALSRAARALRPRLRHGGRGSAARGRRLRLLRAGAVLEPDLLRRRRRAARRPAMRPRAGPALCLRAARPVAAVRARLAAGLPQLRPRLGARARSPTACSTSCRASGWCSTSTASTAPARASASTAISIWRAGCYDKVQDPAPLRRASPTTRMTVSPGELIERVHGRQPRAQARHDRRCSAAAPATASRRCASASTRAATSAPAAATRTSDGCARADRMYVPPVRHGVGRQPPRAR